MDNKKDVGNHEPPLRERDKIQTHGFHVDGTPKCQWPSLVRMVLLARSAQVRIAKSIHDEIIPFRIPLITKARSSSEFKKTMENLNFQKACAARIKLRRGRP